MMDESEREGSEKEPLLTEQTSRTTSTREEYDASLGSPDGLRAWIVASSIFVVNFMIIGLGRVSGIFYVDFMKVFKINRTVASAPFSVQQSTRNLFGPVVGILGQMFGVRAVTMIGGLLAAISAAGCGFAPDIFWITILWGDLYGIATAFTSTINQLLINQYFLKNRSTASGLAFAGGSVGAMAFPFAVDYLMHNWGVPGTYFAMGGMLLLIVPIAIIMKTPPWLRRGEEAPHAPTNESIKKSSASSKSPQTSDFDQKGFLGKIFRKAEDKGKRLFPTTESSKESAFKSSASSESAQTSEGIFGKILSKVEDQGKEFLSSELPTNSLTLKDKLSKFFMRKNGNGDDTGTSDERTPLIPVKDSSDVDSKLKNLISFKTIAVKFKQMFLQTSTDPMTDPTSVSTDRMTDSIPVSTDPMSMLEEGYKSVKREESNIGYPDKESERTRVRLKEMAQDSTTQQENLDSIDTILEKGNSANFLKNFFFSVSSKIKQLINLEKHTTDEFNTEKDPGESNQPRKQSEVVGQIHESTPDKSSKVFSTPYIHPTSSLKNMQAQNSENLLQNEITQAENITSEVSEVLQHRRSASVSNVGQKQMFEKKSLTSVTEMDESSSAASCDVTITPKFSGEVENSKQDNSSTSSDATKLKRSKISEIIERDFLAEGFPKQYEQAEIITKIENTMNSESGKQSTDSKRYVKEEVLEQDIVETQESETPKIQTDDNTESSNKSYIPFTSNSGTNQENVLEKRFQKKDYGEIASSSSETPSVKTESMSFECSPAKKDKIDGEQGTDLKRIVKENVQDVETQASAKTGLQFTIHLKKQEFQTQNQSDSRDKKDTFFSTSLKPDKQTVQEKEVKDVESVSSTVKTDLQSLNKRKKKGSRKKFKVEDKVKEATSIETVSTILTETDFSSPSLLTSVNVQKVSSAQIGGQNIPEIEPNDKSSIMFMRDPNINQEIITEKRVQKKIGVDKTLPGPLTPSIKTDFKSTEYSLVEDYRDADNGIATKRNIDIQFESNPSMKQKTVEILSQSTDNAFTAYSTSFADPSTSSMKVRGTDSEYSVTEEKQMSSEISESKQSRELTPERYPQFEYKRVVHVDKSFRDEMDSQEGVFTTLTSKTVPINDIQETLSTVINIEAGPSQISLRDEIISATSNIFPEDQRVEVSVSRDFEKTIRSFDREEKETISSPLSQTVINILEQSNLSANTEEEEIFEGGSPLQRKSSQYEVITSVSGAKKKERFDTSLQKYERSESKNIVPFWPGTPTNVQSKTVKSTNISKKIKFAGMHDQDSDIKNEETELSTIYVDFRYLHENINYIVQIIRIAESLKQMEMLSSSFQTTESEYLSSEKSEIRKALGCFFYSIEETALSYKPRQSKSDMELHDSTGNTSLNISHRTNKFLKGNEMFGPGQDNPNLYPSYEISSKNELWFDESEVCGIGFENQHVYELLVTVFRGNESAIASHFPEQDQAHILEVVLELKKLARICQTLEKKCSNISARNSSETAVINVESKQLKRIETNVSYAQNFETQHASDSTDTKYGLYESINEQITDPLRNPSRYRYYKNETSSANLETKRLLNRSENNQNENENHHTNSVWEHFKVAFKLHSNPLFLLVCLCRVVHLFTFMSFLTIIVDYGVDRGLKVKDGNFLIIAISVGDLIGRLCCGWLTDYGIVSMEMFMLLSMLTQGACSISIPFIPADYIYAMTIVFSILQGAVFVRHPILVSKYTKHHEHSIGMGFINLPAGILGFALPSYIGYFRDILGSYNEFLYSNGGVCIFVGLLWSFVPCFLKHCAAQPEAAESSNKDPA